MIYTLNGPIILAFVLQLSRLLCPDAHHKDTTSWAGDSRCGGVPCTGDRGQGASWNLHSPAPRPCCCSLPRAPEGGSGSASLWECGSGFLADDKKLYACCPWKRFGSHGSGTQILPFCLPSQLLSWLVSLHSLRIFFIVFQSTEPFFSVCVSAGKGKATQREYKTDARVSWDERYG